VTPMRRFHWVAAILIGVTSGKANAGDNVIASSRWYVNCKPGDAPVIKDCGSTHLLTVEVLRLDDGATKLRVSDLQNGKSVHLAEFERGEDFLGMWPTRDSGGNLITLWVGGSANHLFVLHYAKGRIVPVLDDGAGSPPEFAECLAGEPAVLLTHWQMPSGAKDHLLRPTGSDVYCWSGESYAKATTAPWVERFARASSACCPR